MDLAKELEKDVQFGPILKFHLHKQVPNGVDLGEFTAECKGYRVEDGVLVNSDNRVVVPDSLRKLVFDHYHTNIFGGGHFGYIKTLKKCRKFYWPNMRSDFERWTKECVLCQRRSELASLNKGQLITLECSQHPEANTIYQYAPAGTGKTFTLAMMVLYQLLTDHEACILLVSPTNHAMVNLASSVLDKCGSLLQRLETLLMISRMGEDKTRYGKSETWLQHSTLALLKMLEQSGNLEKLSSGSLSDVKRYLKIRQSLSRQPAGEKVAAKVVSDLQYPKVVFATAHMAELTADVFNRTTFLIYDEAGQIMTSHVMMMVASLPNLKKLIFTGDHSQLPVSTIDIPTYLTKFGVESIIDRASKQKSVTMTSLKESFRSHKFIIECLSYGAYDGMLVKAKGLDPREALIRSKFPLPVNGYPVVLIHFPDKDSDREGTSRANEAQTKAVERLAQHLHEKAPNLSVGLLSLYSFQTRVLEARVKQPSDKAAVDSYQGREVDVAVVITTRSDDTLTNDEAQDTTKFILCPRRTTTALSRAKHAIFLIANFDFILNGQVYEKFVTKALEHVPIVDSKYLDLLDQQQSRRNGAILVDEKGNPPIARGLRHHHNKEWERKFPLQR